MLRKPKLLITECKYKNDSIEDLKKDYPEEIKNLEESLLNYVGENDLKYLKTCFLDKWKNLTKNLAYPYENFNSIGKLKVSVKVSLVN